MLMENANDILLNFDTILCGGNNIKEIVVAMKKAAMAFI